MSSDIVYVTRTADEFIKGLRPGTVIQRTYDASNIETFLSGEGDVARISDARSHPGMKSVHAKYDGEHKELVRKVNEQGYELRTLRHIPRAEISHSFYVVTRKGN